MPFSPSTSALAHRKSPTAPLPSRAERQKQQQSRMVREQPDDTPREQRMAAGFWAERQMG